MHTAKIAVSEKFCQKRYGVVNGEKTAVLTIGIVKDTMVLALPSTDMEGRPLKGKPSCVVDNEDGKQCQLRLMRVPIIDRHQLTRQLPFGEEVEEYNDFPSDYFFRTDNLVESLQDAENAGLVEEGRVKDIDDLKFDAQAKAEEAEEKDEIEDHLADTQAEEQPTLARTSSHGRSCEDVEQKLAPPSPTDCESAPLLTPTPAPVPTPAPMPPQLAPPPPPPGPPPPDDSLAPGDPAASAQAGQRAQLPGVPMAASSSAAIRLAPPPRETGTSGQAAPAVLGVPERRGEAADLDGIQSNLQQADDDGGE